MQESISAGQALFAGLVSFLSPCVLPLVPGYISMLSGMGVEELKRAEGKKTGLFASSLAFVMGFSVVFIAFGASASAVGRFLLVNKAVLAPVAGAMILLFGLHLIGWLAKISQGTGLAVGLALFAAAAGVWAMGTTAVKPIHLASLAIIFLLGPLLTRLMNRDVRLHTVGGKPGQAGPLSAFLMGFAFAFGWSPCIGPILATVLLLAASKETIGQGVFLLAVYSAGLAIPFLLTAAGISRFLRFYQNFRRHLHTVEVVSGVLLLFIGGLIYFNRLTWLSDKLAFLNRFAL